MGQSGGHRGAAYLAVQADGEEHEEEEDGPQRRDGQSGHSLRVHHERQAGACNGVHHERQTRGTPQT